MESEVEEMTNKWFDETLSYMQKRSGPTGRLDLLIPGCLLCGREYCNGIFALLKDKHKLPGAALLRILCELDLKLLWCLHAPDKTDAVGTDSCYQRFRRWNYLSLTQNRKMFRDFSGLSSGTERLAADKKIHELDADIATLEKEQLKSIPFVEEICRNLSGSLSSDFTKVYPMVYRRFSWAVHLDLAVIKDMVHVCGGHVQFFNAPPSYCKEEEMLRYCAAMGCDINLVVRKHYAWDCDKMLHEFHRFVQSRTENHENEQPDTPSIKR